MLQFKKIIAFVILVLSLSISAQTAKPNVLVVADGLYNEPARTAGSILKDRANVLFWKNASWASSTALANFKQVLDGKKWDLILLNFGFNDIMHKAPGVKAIRAMHKDAGGVPVTPPDQYAKNLRELLKRFKAAGSKVMWMETTAIVGSNGILYAGDEMKYNKIAAAVMKEHSVPVIKMHSYSLAAHKTMPRGQGNTYSYKNSKLPLHTPMVKSIMDELKLQRQIKGPVKVYLVIGDNTTAGQGVVADTRKPRKGKAGTLDELVLNPATAAKYKHLGNAKGWSSRPDVWVNYRSSGNLGVGYGERGNNFGPELALGHIMGNKHNQQILIFKSYIRATLSDKNFFKQNHSLYQQLMSQIDQNVTKMEQRFPDYNSKIGYDFGGVIIGYNSNEKDLKQYAANLSKLISSLRKDLKKPNLKFVILGAGQGGTAEKKNNGLIKIQQAAAKDPNVAFVDTRQFWPDKAKSPEKAPERWYGNAESFYKIGEAAAAALK